jgi:hypothetical protein
MRATGRLAVLAAVSALGMTPFAAAAQALPPAPYQTADRAGGGAAQQNPQNFDRYGGGAAQQNPQSLDRYGGGARRSDPVAYQPSAQGAARQPSGPYLTWAGKTEMQAAPAAQAQGGGWSTMSRQWAAEPQRQVQPQAQPQFQPRYQPQAQAAQMGPPVNPWRPVYQQNTAPRPAPTSIYDAPAKAQAASPPPQSYRQAQANRPANPEGGPRFYSLHREYGIQPDPIPLPPQFFGPTADLSAAVGGPLAKRTTIVDGQAKTVNVPDDQGAQ